MKKLIITESPNDQYFVMALLRHLGLSDVDVQKLIETDELQYDTLQDFEGDDGKTYKGLSPKAITQKFKTINRELGKKYEELDQIGLIIDADTDGVKNRIGQINAALAEVWGLGAGEIKQENMPAPFQIQKNGETFSLNIVVFCMKVGEQGELETVLHQIKSQRAVYADCLENWRNCASRQEPPYAVSDKEMSKLAMQFYLRYDTLDKKFRNEYYTNFEAIMIGKSFQKTDNKEVKARATEIFDFDSEYLSDLKQFLNTFAS